MKQKHKSKAKYFPAGLAFIFITTFLLAGCTAKNTPANSDAPQTASQASKPAETDSPSFDTSNPDLESDSSPSETDLSNSQADNNLPTSTPNLDAMVTQLLEDGVKARPTITTDVAEGQVAEQRLGEDDGTDITVKFTSDTVFQIEEIDRSTYSAKYIDATKEDVKKDSSIYVWGTYSGTELLAERVVVQRFI